MNEGKEREETLAAEAARELLRYPEFSAGQSLKRGLKKLAGRKVPAADRYSWPGGLLALGLFRYLEAGSAGAWAAGGIAAGRDESRKSAADSLIRYFDSWEAKGWGMRSLEDMLSAQVLLLAWEGEAGLPEGAERRESWRAGIQRAADYLKAYPRTGTGSLPYRADQDNGHVYVDALGMAAPFLVSFGLHFGDGEALRTGLLQFTNFLEYGMQEATGLPYHGFEGNGRVRHGLPGWGRGTGWLLLGLAEALTAWKRDGRGTLPEEGNARAAEGTAVRTEKEIAARAAEETAAQVTEETAVRVEKRPAVRAEEISAARMREAFVGLADTVCAHIRADGTLSWLLTAEKGPADSSGLAMCCYGIGLGLREGLLSSGRYEQELDRARLALAGQVREGRVYGASGECGGFGVYPQQYGAYPWSLGPALGFFSLWPAAEGGSAR